ncbi:hypothetical protein [Rhizobium johnstonii]|uniref:hypothetical protein n=1 Tax=Rhizobium johnstonii TaxID=3019933 RepID=UPI003F95171B
MFSTERERAKAAIERLIRKFIAQRVIVAMAFLSIVLGLGAVATPYFIDTANYARKLWNLKLNNQISRIESALQVVLNINYQTYKTDGLFYSESRAVISQTASIDSSTCVLNVKIRVNVVYLSKTISAVEFKESNTAAYNENISINLSDVEHINIYNSINNPRGIYYDQARTEWTAGTGTVHISSGSVESIKTMIDGKILQEEWAKENPYFTNGWAATFYTHVRKGEDGLSDDLSSVARYCGSAKLA